MTPGRSVHRAALLLLTLLLLTACAQTAQRGDRVTIEFVSSLENGTVVSTTSAEVAKANGIYSPEHLYGPISFVLGKDKIKPEGLVEGIIGMREGEQRRIVLPPEKAFGPVKQGLIRKVRIRETTPRVLSVEREKRVPAPPFFSQHLDAKPGDQVRIDGASYTFLRREGPEVILRSEHTLGEQLPLPNVPWNGTITAVNATHFLVRQDPPEKEIVQLPRVGPARLSVTPNEVSLSLLAQVGDYWNIKDVGVGKIIAKNATHMVVDCNDPLAGKTLIFDVTLVSREHQ